MPPIDEQRRHALYLALEALIGAEQADTLISMLPPSTWDELATRAGLVAVTEDVLLLRRDVEILEHKVLSTLHRELRDQTRSLTVALLGAMAAMTSVCVSVAMIVS